MNPGLSSLSSWKIHKLKEIISSLTKQGYTTPFIAIVETWLKPYIADAQLILKHYQLFRADRIGPKNGGCLLYIMNNIPINETASFDDGVCSSVVCLSSTNKCILVALYRPPTAPPESFNKLIKFIDAFLTKYNTNNNHKTFIFGDFNFPGVRWDNGTNFTCPNAPQSFSKFCSFINKFFLTQTVNENTRQGNILDLFLTDDSKLIPLIQIENTPLSDHNILKIHTPFFKGTVKQNDYPKETSKLNDFNKLNLKSSNITKISQELYAIDWDSIISGCIDDFPEKFHNSIFWAIRKHTKLKTSNKRKFSSRGVRILNRKIRKYIKKYHFLGIPLRSKNYKPS